MSDRPSLSAAQRRCAMRFAIVAVASPSANQCATTASTCFSLRLRARSPLNLPSRNRPIRASAYERSRRVPREPSRRAARSSCLKSQLRSFTPPVSGATADTVNDGVVGIVRSAQGVVEPDPMVEHRRRSREDAGGFRRIGRTTGNGRRPRGRPPPDRNELSGTGRSGVITISGPAPACAMSDAFSGAALLRRLRSDRRLASPFLAPARSACPACLGRQPAATPVARPA